MERIKHYAVIVALARGLALLGVKQPGSSDPTSSSWGKRIINQ